MNNKNTIYKIIYCCSKHKILISNYYKEIYVISAEFGKYREYLYIFSKPKLVYDYIEFNITKKEIRYCFTNSINKNIYFKSYLYKINEFGIPCWFNDLKKTASLF